MVRDNYIASDKEVDAVTKHAQGFIDFLKYISWVFVWFCAYQVISRGPKWRVLPSSTGQGPLDAATMLRVAQVSCPFPSVPLLLAGR